MHTMRAHELVERTAALVPMLRANAARAEQARRVPVDNFDALSEAGVLKMCAPKRYGGSEADFQTQCDVLAQVARGCPSTSWVATIFSAMSWLASVFPDEAQEEIFDTHDPRISGVFSPTGTATRKDGGYVVSGRWPFNTGCHGANWTVLNAVLASDPGAGLPMCVIAKSKDLAIQDDWNASGMAATGSNTIVAENVFVPAYRVMPLPDMLEAKYPARHNAQDVYYNYPLAPVLTINAGGTPLGIARGALESFFERLPGRQITYTFYTNKADAPITHLQVGEASLMLESADAHVRLATALLDRHRGGPMSKESRVKSRANIAYATGLSRQVVDLLFFSSGASSIQTQVPIQRFQRDIQALANHAIMHSPTALELYGRVLCGLEPNTLLY
jgi:alkylation response protein AidB-like acyl-CoA dehydrogenase